MDDKTLLHLKQSFACLLAKSDRVNFACICFDTSKLTGLPPPTMLAAADA
jgi:hypothetical protein